MDFLASSYIYLDLYVQVVPQLSYQKTLSEKNQKCESVFAQSTTIR